MFNVCSLRGLAFAGLAALTLTIGASGARADDQGGGEAKPTENGTVKPGEHRNGNRHSGGGLLGQYRHMWRKLNLTSDQKEKLFGLRQKFHTDSFRQEQARERGKFHLQRELTRSTLDDEKIQKLTDGLIESQRVLLLAQVDFIKEVHAILTPDQLAKLHAMMDRAEIDRDNKPAEDQSGH